MQVYPNRFKQQISKGLSPFYLVFGDEPLQKMLSIELIRKHALNGGFDERQSLTVDSQFNWEQLLEATQTLSLFSSKLFIEVELPTGKPGAQGSKVLTGLAQQTNPDTLIVIHGQKIGKDVQNAKWFKQLDKQGVYIPCYPLEGNQLQQWISSYLQELSIRTSEAGVRLISDFCEGNLLAAKQEIDKLLLQYPNGQVSDQQIEQAIVDQSRFNVFQLVDVMLSGDANKMVKMLYRLEAEGIEPTIILWAVSREWQILTHLFDNQSSGTPINWNQHRIWKNRQSLYLATLQRIDHNVLSQIQQKLQQFDYRLKQSQVLRPYVELCHICLLFMAFDLKDIPFD